MARFARDPTAEERVAANGAGYDSPEMHLVRLRQMLDRGRLDLLSTASQFRRMVQKGGQSEIEALLEDPAQITGIYDALSALLVALDDTAVVPDITEE